MTTRLLNAAFAAVLLAALPAAAMAHQGIGTDSVKAGADEWLTGSDTIIIAGDAAGTMSQQQSDSYDVSIPSPFYKTPEAAAFQRYGEHGTGSFNGDPGITVPLYTLRYKDTEIPLALVYDAGGIRVSQEASWVGLGWNLMVGGCINYVPSGSTDPRQLLLSHAAWDEFLTQGSGDMPVVETDLDGEPYLKTDMQAGYGERDYMQATLPGGRSLSFYYDPVRGACQVFGNDGDQYRIVDTYGCGYSDLGEARWAITDGDGWTYYFAPGERTTDVGQALEYTSTWDLSRIVTAEGSVVDFQYQSPGEYILSRAQLHEQYDYLTGQNLAHYPSPGYSCTRSLPSYQVRASYPLVIDTYDQTITFTVSTRDDLPGARKLDRITVKSKLSGAVVREFRFSYGYFQATATGGDCLTGSTYSGGSNALELRLKLLSVEELADTASLVTSFSYNEDVRLPIKTSYSCDFWGYYNGCLNSSTSFPGVGYTMLPTPLPLLLNGEDGLNTVYRRMGAATRYCSPAHARAGMLRRTTYPTGGYTEFDFEPHSFTGGPMKYPTVSQYQDRRTAVTAIDYNRTTDTPYRMFTLDSQGKGTITVSFTGKLSKLLGEGAKVTLYPHDPGSGSIITYDLTTASDINLGTAASYQKTFDIDLPANGYTLVATCPDALGSSSGYGVTASLRLMQPFTDSYVPESTGGGMRVARITNHDSTGAVTDSTVYRYEGADGRTSGRLLRPVTSFESKTTVSNYSIGSMPGQTASVLYHAHRLRTPSCDMPAPYTAMSGGTVGYSIVTRLAYDGDGVLQGSEETCYTDSLPHRRQDRYWFFYTYANGSVESQTVRDASGDTVRRVVNTYDRTASSAHRCSVLVDDCMVDNTGEYTNHTSTKHFKLWFYPFRQEWCRIAMRVETEYRGGVGNVTTTVYDYNTVNHRVRTATTQSGDTCVSQVTRYYYPSDFTGTVEKAMADSSSFLVNRLVQVSEYSKTGGTSTLRQSRRDVFTRYANRGRDLSRTVFLRTSSRFALNGGAPVERLTYQYTGPGDLRYSVKDGTEKMVCLWGYGSIYPVAEIRGATYTQVSQWLTASFITGLSKATEGVPALLAQLRAKLAGKDVQVTTYTYTPLVGMTSCTMPNGDVTYYDYDAFGRLLQVRDGDGTAIEGIDYNYGQ